MALELSMGWAMFLFFLLFDSFVVLSLMLVKRPTLLATVFALAGFPWVLLRTNQSKGGHCQPFFWFNNFVARSAGCGVQPKLKL